MSSPVVSKPEQKPNRKMTRTVPEYDEGDRIEIPARKLEGVIVSRWWSDANNCWLYQIKTDSGEIDVSIYQEKNLSQ